ncbi:putative 3-isopropylmalate dehydratase [Helianthus anomalus]
MEFVGTTNESLSMVEIMKVCNMVVEVRGKNGIVPADATTYKYIETRLTAYTVSRLIDFGKLSGRNHPVVTVSLIALGTRNGPIDVIDDSVSDVAASFSVHDGIGSGLNKLKMEVYSFSIALLGVGGVTALCLAANKFGSI